VSGTHQSKLTLMSESLRNDGRVWVPKRPADQRPPQQIPEEDRDYYLERKYPSFGNLVPRDVASRNAKVVCDEGRGVGESGLAVYDYAIKRGVSAEHVVVMGRSLGSGVASMLAGARSVGAAVLITPYDSLSAVAAGHYPFLPVRLLLRHPFPSSDWAKRTRAPALLLAAEHDDVVPAIHAQKLFEVWAGPKQIHVLAQTGHNDIEMHADYYRLINEFLVEHLAQ